MNLKHCIALFGFPSILSSSIVGQELKKLLNIYFYVALYTYNTYITYIVSKMFEIYIYKICKGKTTLLILQRTLFNK